MMSEAQKLIEAREHGRRTMDVRAWVRRDKHGYRSMIDGEPYVLVYDEKRGGTVLEPYTGELGA